MLYPIGYVAAVKSLWLPQALDMWEPLCKLMCGVDVKRLKEFYIKLKNVKNLKKNLILIKTSANVE